MKYRYRKDEDGSLILIVDEECPQVPEYEEVLVHGNYIYISDTLFEDDPYDGNRVAIPVEAWEKVKSFVDNQIATKGN